MADELMSDIPFCTTPKGYLLHNSYIFRKMELLGTEMKNLACSRLGTMLYLDIQKGKEAMNTSKPQKDTRDTNVCMERLAVANKGCGQLKSNDTYFENSWFSSVKNSEEAMAEGVDYCGLAKTIHKVFLG